jgi:exodeoxyribonuclease VIII
MKEIKLQIQNLQTKTDSIEDYHSKECISASGLKLIFKKSVYHYLNKKPLQSKSLDLGISTHIMVYEGYEEFLNRYFIMPKLDLRRKEDKEIKEKLLKKAGDKILLSQDDDTTIRGIYENLMKSDIAQFYTKGDIEISHYGQYDGVDVRVRPDCIAKDRSWISDVKTCQDSSPRAFRMDLYKWSYHLQCVFYCDMLGVDPKNFRFIACETQYPYQVQVYSLSDDLIEKGRDGYKSAFKYWKMYLNENVVPGFIGEYNTDGSIII